MFQVPHVMFTHVCVVGHQTIFKTLFQVADAGDGGNRLDFEESRSHTVVIGVAGPGSSSPLGSWFSLNVSVTDANEKPFNIRLSSYTALENLTAGSPVAVISADDAEGNSVTFRVKGTSGFLGVKGRQLVLRRKLDYESRKTLNFTVVAKDDGIPPAVVTCQESMISDIDHN